MTALRKVTTKNTGTQAAKPNQMAVAREVMKKRRSLLRELAK